MAHAPPTQAITFWSAWLVPGVISFSLCNLCLKLTNTSVMMWLPTYSTSFLHFDEHQKALIATLFDIGTIVGSIVLGLISDFTYGKRSPVAVCSLLIATVGFIFVILLDERHKEWLFVLIFILGFLVGGISNMIVGAAVADMGKLEALLNNDKSLSTITGIIDGTGSLGAACG